MALSDEQIEALNVRTLGHRHFARAIEAEVRKDDEALIQRMLEALETCNDSGPYPHYYEVELVEEAAAAARARLTPPTV